MPNIDVIHFILLVLLYILILIPLRVIDNYFEVKAQSTKDDFKKAKELEKILKEFEDGKTFIFKHHKINKDNWVFKNGCFTRGIDKISIEVLLKKDKEVL